MKNSLKFTLLFLIFVAGQIKASAPAPSAPAQVAPAARTFKDADISTASILSLAPKASEEVEKSTQEYLTQNPEIARTALGYEPIKGSLRPFHVATREMLASKGLANQSQCNYVFRLPTQPGYMVKIAGHVNRKENLCRLAATLAARRLPESQDKSPDEFYSFALRGYSWGRELNDADYELFKQVKPESCDFQANEQGAFEQLEGCPKTFQTVSRMAHYLLFLQAKEKNNFQHVSAPVMHLVHIPGRPTTVSDRNYVVIEKQVTGLTPVETVTPQEAEEVETVIKETGLFDLNKESLMRTAEGKLIILDWEQPNNSDPSTFFHESNKAFENNVNAGLGEFRKNFKVQ